MSITEIPPRNPVPAAQPPTPPGGDLYDASSWESAYLEMHDVPALLIQLQDDLSRSRQREAFWISVVVHLAIVILVVNSTRLEGLMHKRSVILVSPQDLMKQKDLTYLELPPDEQKLTKRPDTNKISDKDRIATSKAPATGSQGTEEDSGQRASRRARPERAAAAQQPQPAAPAPQAPQEQPSPPAAAASEPGGPPADSARRNDPRRVSAPARCPRDRPSSKRPARPCRIAADTAAMAETMAWARASKAAKPSDRWTSSATPWAWISALIWPRVLHDVRENWYRIIPESARAPLMKKGKVSIEFAILKDGQVAGLQIVGYVRRRGARSRRLRRDYRVQTFSAVAHRVRRPISGACASTSTTTRKDRKSSKAASDLGPAQLVSPHLDSTSKICKSTRIGGTLRLELT